MSDALKQVVEDLQKSWHDMKAANDARLAEIEKKNHADPLLTEQVEKINSRITELQKKVEEVDTAGGRPGIPAAANEPMKEAKEKHRKAFLAYCRDPIRHEGNLREVSADLEKRTVTVGTTTEGGYAVPEELDRTIREYAQARTPMRDLATVITAGTGYKTLVETGEAGSGWVGELDARTETATPGLAAITLNHGTIYANAPASEEALDDIMFDVEAWLTRAIGRKFAKEEDIAFLTGNGTDKPKGILAYTLSLLADGARTFGQIQKIESGTDGTFDGDDILRLIYTLNAQYRMNARFVMPGATVASIRYLKDSNDNYLWQPGLQAGQPMSLAGFPIVEDENVPAMAADANAVLFGDFKEAYQIVDIRGLRMLRDPYTTKGKVLFYATRRLGGNVVNDNAVKVLTLSAP